MVGVVSIPTYKKCYAGANFEFPKNNGASQKSSLLCLDLLSYLLSDFSIFSRQQFQQPPNKKTTSHGTMVQARRGLYCRLLTVCLSVHPGQKIVKYHKNRRVPGWSTNRPWDGKVAIFVGTENRGDIWRLVGREGMTNWWPGGPFQWVHPLVLLKHTTINLGSAGWGLNRAGDGESAAFCCVHFFVIMAGDLVWSWVGHFWTNF